MATPIFTVCIPSYKYHSAAKCWWNSSFTFPLSLFFHLFFFLWVQASTSPPPSLLLPLSMRPLCSAFQSLTGGLSMPPSHWPSLTTWSQSGLPCSTIRLALRVFTWNNSTAAVGKEQGLGKRQREGETASPKWTWPTYSNISFVSFQLFSSSVAPFSSCAASFVSQVV